LVFSLGEIEGRYQTVATLVSLNTDPTGIILSQQHSGSIRYYAGRNILRYDVLDPAWLDRAVAWLQAHHIHPYLVLDDWERIDFQHRFASQNTLGRLTYSPFIVSESGITTSLYDLQPGSGIAPAPRIFYKMTVPSYPPPPVAPP
jgi:hypothetical protein